MPGLTGDAGCPPAIWRRRAAARSGPNSIALRLRAGRAGGRDGTGGRPRDDRTPRASEARGVRTFRSSMTGRPSTGLPTTSACWLRDGVSPAVRSELCAPIRRLNLSIRAPRRRRDTRANASDDSRPDHVAAMSGHVWTAIRPQNRSGLRLADISRGAPLSAAARAAPPQPERRRTNRPSGPRWMPHSVLSGLSAQRPARASSPGRTGRVQGAQPTDRNPRPSSGWRGRSWAAK